MGDMPKWNPTYKTRKRLRSEDFYERYNALRFSSLNFTKHKDVRAYIFNRDGGKCVKCGSTERPTIDHIKSVYYMAWHPEHIFETNDEQNLQTLCLRCNSGKKVEEL